MSEPLIVGLETDPKKLAQRLRDMADTIDRNDAAAFGGAFVIIPPIGAGVTLETLILDGQQDPASFYILLKGKIDSALAALDAAQRAGQSGFRR